MPYTYYEAKVNTIYANERYYLKLNDDVRMEFPKQESIMFSRTNLADNWPLLRLEVHTQQMVGDPNIKYLHKLNYALDEELHQLFDYLTFVQRLEHQNRLATHTNNYNKLAKSYNELYERTQELERQCALAARPWYRKLWDFLTSTHEV